MTAGEARFRKFLRNINESKNDLEIMLAGHQLVDEYRGFHYEHIAVATESNIRKMVDEDGMIISNFGYEHFKLYDSVNDMEPGSYYLSELPYGVLGKDRIFLVSYNNALVSLRNPSNTYSHQVAGRFYQIPPADVKKYIQEYLVV